MQSIVSWEPNDVLFGTSRYIRDSLERAMTLLFASMSIEQSKKTNSDFAAPLILTEELVSTETYIVISKITGVFCSSFSHEEALHGYIFPLTESGKQKITRKSIISL